MREFSVAPKELVGSFWRNRGLIVQMIRREVVGRYRGSVLGMLWSFFNPLLMLAVYTFVFSVVFRARWQGGGDSRTEFALVLFAGLVVFNVFSECISRAPGLILGNVAYVKKVVFPLEILPMVALGSALFHLLVSLVVWLLFYLVFFGLPKATGLLLPAILLPLILLTLGAALLLSSLGVYLRDISQFIGVVVSVLMFMSPIFYPLAAIPDEIRPYLMLNPVTIAIEQARDVLIFGRLPNWVDYLSYLTVSAAVAWLGFAWFQKTRRGFADVL